MKRSYPPTVVAATNIASEVAAVRPARRLKVVPGLILVALLNAICYPLITVGLSFAPILPFAALRAFIAGTTLAALACLLRRKLPRRPATWALLAAIGVATTSFGYLGMFHGAQFVSPGLATLIANSQPFLAAILALLFLRERLGALRLFGLLLGFAGIVAVSLPKLAEEGHSGFALGVGYIVLAATGVAIGNVLMKALCERIDPLVAMAAQLLFGAVPLAVAAMSHRQSPIVWTPAFLGSLLGLALPGTALAYWLWFSILERVPLNRANAFTFLTPFFGVSLGVAFFGEHLGVIALGGLLLTAAGVVLVERSASQDR